MGTDLLNYEQFMEICAFLFDNKEYMDDNDLDINNDLGHVTRILKGLKKFDGGCPCILAHPKCPCEDSLKKIEETGKCHCGLFYKKKESKRNG